MLIAVLMVAVISVFSQTAQSPKPSFDVISIKPSPPPSPNGGIRSGGGARGNRYTMSNATLKMLLQQGYQQIQTGGPGQLQIVGTIPNWMDSERYDIQATVDCSGGVLAREQVQLMVQSMLEDRFQLKAHMETRELPIYNLIVGKDGPKLKASEDQTAPNAANGGPPLPCGPVPAGPAVPPPPPPLPPPPPPVGGLGGGPGLPNFVQPRGSMMMMVNSSGMTLQGAAVPITTLITALQQQVGRQVVDKTELKGLFDYRLQFSPEGLGLVLPPGAPPPPVAGPGGAGPTPPTAADPVPSLFTAIQDLGLKLEAAKGPVKVLVIDSVQKPTVN